MHGPNLTFSIKKALFDILPLRGLKKDDLTFC